MSSSTTGDIGINGNLNVSNTLNSSGLTVNSGTVNFTGAAFTNSCIPSAAISGGSSNASTIAVANDQSLTLTGAYIPYCGVTNTNVALKTNPGLRYNAVTGTLSAILFNGYATTQSTSDNSTSLATTEFVQNNILSLSSIYATIASLSNYLTTSNASSTYVSKANPTISSNLTLPTSYTAPILGQLGYSVINIINTTATSGSFSISSIPASSLSPGVWLFTGRAHFSSLVTTTWALIQIAPTTVMDASIMFKMNNPTSGADISTTRIITLSGTIVPMILAVQLQPSQGGAITGEFSAIRIA